MPIGTSSGMLLDAHKGLSKKSSATMLKTASDASNNANVTIKHSLSNKLKSFSLMAYVIIEFDVKTSILSPLA